MNGNFVVHKTKSLFSAISLDHTHEQVNAGVKGEGGAKVGVLKQDLALFSRLYISCQTRDGNLEEFFKFKNQPWPPSLSQPGQLRGGQKADLFKCLPNSSSQCTTQPTIDAAILDGAVIVQMLKPGTAQTFEDYFNYVFAPYIARQLETV